MKTESTSVENAKASRQWWVVDAAGQTLGRLATEISAVLRGKHKTSFSPHVDGGDFVVVTNCTRIHVTGGKMDSMRYYRHSQHPGHLHSRTMREQLVKAPDQVLFQAVRGMMPKTRLARAQMKKLRIYTGSEHPHVAQQPQALTLGDS